MEFRRSHVAFYGGGSGNSCAQVLCLGSVPVFQVTLSDVYGKAASQMRKSVMWVYDIQRAAAAYGITPTLKASPSTHHARRVYKVPAKAKGHPR